MVQPGENLELYDQLSVDQRNSLPIAYPDFEALSSVPGSLGSRAHERLEQVLGMPIASDDSRPDTSDSQTGHFAGISLGDRFGREKEFTKNLPKIEGDIAALAQERGVSSDEVWSGIQDILVASGIGQPMHRTLSRPLGGEQGAREYISNHGSDGIAIVVRENIANWGARRQQQLHGLLGSLPLATIPNVQSIIYAGSGRPISGVELWRPELRPYVTGTDEKGNEQSSLTEVTVATELHIPETESLLTKLGMHERTTVHPVVSVERGASGDAVMSAIAAEHGDALKDMLIVEVGNAPAGYTQLMGGLVLAKELGIDSEQYVAVSDGVTIVRPDHFKALTPEQKSKVQNTATALNSINGWLKAVVDTNAYLLEQRS